MLGRLDNCNMLLLLRRAPIVVRGLWQEGLTSAAHVLKQPTGHAQGLP